MPDTAATRNLDGYRTRLHELKQQIGLDLEVSRQRSMNLSDGTEETGSGQRSGSGFGDHIADDATEVFERGKELGLEQTLELHLKQVERALSRVDDGTYGECESCGTAIPKARLDAIPEATLCVNCKSEEESKTPAGREEAQVI
jgi:RNA polymerase-binding transcription factor DksA